MFIVILLSFLFYLLMRHIEKGTRHGVRILGSTIAFRYKTRLTPYPVLVEKAGQVENKL